MTENGIFLSDLPAGALLQVETKGHVYSLVNSGGGRAWISGHPDYCPLPVEVTIAGSSQGKPPSLTPGFIGLGMRLKFWHPSHDLVTTSMVRDIR